MMGSRTKENAKAIAFLTKQNNSKASIGTFAEAASLGELIFNCTAGVATIEALQLAGEKNLGTKVLIDLSNPLDFSKGMLQVLSVCNTSSIGEEIQKIFPQLKVVKSLNTMWCGLMVNPMLANNGDHNVFVSGNDADAKNIVKTILKSFGWNYINIIDLGDITASRGTEMWLPLWLRIYSSLGKGAFNLKIVS